MKRLYAATLAAALACALAPAAAQASFGTSHFDVSFAEAGGGNLTEAGAHPDVFRTQIGFNYTGEGKAALPDGDIQNFSVAQIPGLVGDTTAIPRCSDAAFLAEGNCQSDAQVGEVAVLFKSPTNEEVEPVYNLEPPPGTLLRLGFRVFNLVPVVIDVGLAGPPTYNALAVTRFAHQTLKVFGIDLTLWGVPAHHGTGAPERPFLTLPSSCLGPQLTSYEALSWPSFDAATGTLIAPQSASGATLTHDAGSPPAPEGFHGCGELAFKPTIAAAPTTAAAQSATGLDLSVNVDDPGLTNPGARAGSEVRETIVTLPEGMSANPSLAEGLGACSEAELARESASSAPGEGCPLAAKIGVAEVDSPLIEETLKGALYVAEPYANPFHTLLALYIVVKSPKLGVVVRQAVKVEPDPDSGQLIATAADIPQLPFSSFRVRLREGGRSPLISPPGCGSHTVAATLYPWSGSPPVTSTSAFQISSGPGGSACPAGAAPFHPRFEAAAENDQAGAYSPFHMRITRADGEADISRFSSVLPPGVVGKLAGLAQCPEAAIAQAQGRTGEGGGQEELDSPSCPAASQIGTTTAGAGVGSELTYVGGKLYLAGPYHGAPLSVVAIVPAVAGPFDAGVVVVREALTLNPTTGEVEADGAASDPIPHILKGIPLNVRDLRVNVDEPDFTLNATSCEEESTRATIFGAGTVLAPTSDTPFAAAARYQAAGCASLGFKPKLGLKLKGGTRRGAFPKLRAVYSPRTGDANLKRLALRFPKSEFIEQGHFRTICTRVQFAANGGHGAGCPKGSVYGHVKVWTPLLSEPLKGPVYLRSSNHNLPDAVFALRGPPSAEVNLEVAIRIDSAHGGLRATVQGAPDAPVSRAVVNMQGGQKGLFVNSTDICKGKHRAYVNAKGHNGRKQVTKPLLRAVSCKKAHKKTHKRHHRKADRRRGGRG